MYTQNQGSFAALGYRDLDQSRFSDIVRDIDTALQMTDEHPRRITWNGDYIALIDRDGTRIALGFLPPTRWNPCSYLVLAVGTLDDAAGDLLGAVPNIHLADRLLLRIQDDLPCDTIMRGETPETVDSELIWSLFEMLVKTPTLWQAANSDTRPGSPLLDPHESFEELGVIDTHEVDSADTPLTKCLSRRARPTKPLRLTVHVTGLTIMLASAPLGAFMFTYSMLRDVAGTQAC